MREYLTPDRIADGIHMERDYPGYSLYAFLLVEGSTDERIYKHFIAEDKCQIIVAHSKENAINTLAILEKDHFLGVLAIVDADFMILEGMQPSSQNLLLTDIHDLELMMINSPALEKVLLELGSRDKLSKLEEKHKQDIRSLIMECAMPIGYLRWISLREKLSLKFEALKFDRFIDREDLTINVRHMITSVQGHTTGSTRSQRPLLKDDEIHDRMQQLSSDTHDPWHVCCGYLVDRPA